MKTLHYLIGALLFVALLAASVFLLWQVFQGDAAWKAFLDRLAQQRLAVAAASLAVGLTVVLFALTSFAPQPRRQYIAYDIEGGGAVSISVRAVQDFLSRLKNEFAAVEDLKASLNPQAGAVDVQLDVKLRAGAQIPELCRMLQERTRATLRDKVGLSDIREVRVRVQEIVGEPTRSETHSGDRVEAFTA